MDHPDFDELTIGVATASNRRQLLKRLAAGLAIAVGVGVPASSFLPHGIGDAAARCRVDGSACSKNSDCCGRICLPKNANGHRYCATATSTTTNTSTSTATDTSTSTSTSTATDTSTSTATNTATDTSTSTATNTSTATATNTPSG